MYRDLIDDCKSDTLVALSMWMSYDEALDLVRGYEQDEQYEACQGIMEALELHAGASLSNCRVSNIYYER
jgi:hypothetical protein